MEFMFPLKSTFFQQRRKKKKKITQQNKCPAKHPANIVSVLCTVPTIHTHNILTQTKNNNSVLHKSKQSKDVYI